MGHFNYESVSITPKLNTLVALRIMSPVSHDLERDGSIIIGGLLEWVFEPAKSKRETSLSGLLGFFTLYEAPDCHSSFLSHVLQIRV